MITDNRNRRVWVRSVLVVKSVVQNSGIFDHGWHG